ncbi:MAG: glycosyltransferase family 4 protein [Alphaproteobacteria bacterium]|nr:glycosyltransferase family 4 protein [Alphaproteobacteria bacterium]
MQFYLNRHKGRIAPLEAEPFLRSAKSRAPVIAQEGDVLLLAQRGSEVLLLPVVASDAETKRLAGIAPRRIVEAIVAGEIQAATLLAREDGRVSRSPAPWFLELVRADAYAAIVWLEARQPQRQAAKRRGSILSRLGWSLAAIGTRFKLTLRSLPSRILKPLTEIVLWLLRPVDFDGYFERLDGILAEIDLLDFFTHGSTSDQEPSPVPFDAPDLLPASVAAEPRRRSVLLLHNSYYHFNCLAAGLKARGWDALTVSVEAPDSPSQKFYHGEDINLYDPDSALMTARIRRFLRDVPERFGSVHFYGMGSPSFFPTLWENVEGPHIVPWDLLELRRHRMIIGYMPSGCLDGALQSSIYTLTGGLCDRCIWQLRPEVCSDRRSLAWNRKLERLCDWVGLECDHATPERVSDRTVYGPVVTAIDPQRWHPDLVPPEEMRVQRNPDEVLVYHACGNDKTRRQSGRDIKGTNAVISAVERLQAEGLPVRMIFAHDIPSRQVRFLQVQADIVVDQLNYGRYGANAREAMMLGKPTICRLTPRQADPLPPLRPILEVPMLDATEESVADVLRALVRDPQRRKELGLAARAYAVAWHGQDACAERYERVIKRIRMGLPPDTPEMYPTRDGDAWLP